MSQMSKRPGFEVRPFLTAVVLVACAAGAVATALETVDAARGHAPLVATIGFGVTSAVLIVSSIALGFALARRARRRAEAIRPDVRPAEDPAAPQARRAFHGRVPSLPPAPSVPRTSRRASSRSLRPEPLRSRSSRGPQNGSFGSFPPGRNDVN